MALNQPRQLEAVVVVDAHVRLGTGDLLDERHQVAAVVDRDLDIKPDAAARGRRGRQVYQPRIDGSSSNPVVGSSVSASIWTTVSSGPAAFSPPSA